MQVAITNESTETYSHLGRYFYCEMTSGKHAALVCVAPDYVQVIVSNAAHRVWRGMGKRFENAAAAAAAYKTAEIRAMIETATARAIGVAV